MYYVQEANAMECSELYSRVQIENAHYTVIS
jgi:hypothetical protein